MMLGRANGKPTPPPRPKLRENGEASKVDESGAPSSEEPKQEVEPELPEVRTVGIAQHPKTKQWSAVVLRTRGDQVLDVEVIQAHNSIEYARLDAKELLLATIYQEPA